MMKVKLTTRCGCSRETEVERASQFITVPLLTRVLVNRPESTMTPGKVRKFAFTHRQGKVWIYREVEE